MKVGGLGPCGPPVPPPMVIREMRIGCKKTALLLWAKLMAKNSGSCRIATMFNSMVPNRGGISPQGGIY